MNFFDGPARAQDFNNQKDFAYAEGMRAGSQVGRIRLSPGKIRKTSCAT